MKLSSLLGHASELFQLIRASGKPADSLIDSFFRSHKYLGSHDRRFISETVYGTLRHLRRCDTVLRRVMSSRPYAVSPEEGYMLLLAAYLLLVEKQTHVTRGDLLPHMRSSRLKDELADVLNETVTEEESAENDPEEGIGVRHSFPDWIVKRLLQEYGEGETEKLCASLNTQAPLILRVNTLKTTIEECRRQLHAEGVETRRTRLSPVGLEVPKRINIFRLRAFQQGMFEVQDEGSQLVSTLIDPKPTAKLMDVCAGAGGKTLHFAALMANRGEIVAADVSTYRLDQLRKRARRAGVSNVRARAVKDLSDLNDLFAGYFDIVFVDAPCTGLGTIRRNPGLKWTVTEESVHELSVKQRSILEASAPLVKPGGALVYATCTLLREENEDVVDAFLSNHVEFILVNPGFRLSQLGIHREESVRYVKLLPHREGTDGFFCALLQKSR
ncbi:MAG: 16S rRNA (cytosine(967)-C(5))-methyltransferase RsmB [Ignavibacteria bacterium]|nr:16S rRNA (cytosine(967)-C(5))-methyltransferase RsmB [Ignavibacteria bacterium]